MQQELLLLMLEMAWMTQTLRRTMLIVQFSDFSLRENGVRYSFVCRNLFWMLTLCMQEQVAGISNMRSERPYSTFFDRAFENEMTTLIEQTTANFDATNFKAALKTGLFDYQNARGWYRDVTG